MIRSRRDLEIEARDHVIIGVGQRLWQCDFGEAMDVVELRHQRETEEEEPDEAIIAACEILFESKGGRHG